MFKLYLYGIEILVCTVCLILNNLFKLYLYGIEIENVNKSIEGVNVQIVPLWN